LLTTNEIASLYEAGNESESLATLIGSGGEAALLTNYLAAYWDFDGAYAPNTSWVVTNKAIAIGGLGTYQTGPANLTLFGGEYGPGTIETYPLTTNAALALVGNGALIGNGSNNYANIGGNPLDPQQDLTVSAWFNPNTGGTGYFQTSTRAFVFETTDPTQTYAPISFGIRGTTVTDTNGNPTCDFQWYGMFTDGTKPSCDFYVPVSQVDQWHHVVQIYRAISANPYTNSMECWLDGVLRANAFLTKTNVSVTSLLGFNIGTYRSASGRWFNGYIDEVAFWQRALSTNEIVQLYTNGLAGRSSLTFAPPQILSFKATNSPAGSYTLSWNSLIGQQYGVQASSNLVDWATASLILTGYAATSATPAITIAPAPAPGSFYDPGLTNGSHRFYRLLLEY
jgi:hypothetical protein